MPAKTKPTTHTAYVNFAHCGNTASSKRPIGAWSGCVLCGSVVYANCKFYCVFSNINSPERAPAEILRANNRKACVVQFSQNISGFFAQIIDLLFILHNCGILTVRFCRTLNFQKFFKVFFFFVDLFVRFFLIFENNIAINEWRKFQMSMIDFSFIKFFFNLNFYFSNTI